MNKIVTLLLSSFLTLIVNSSSAGSGSYYFDQVGVVQEGNTIYGLIQLAGELPDSPGHCGNSNKHQITFVVNSELGKILYTNTLAAVTAKKMVWMNWSDINCGWQGNRFLAGRIDIKK